MPPLRPTSSIDVADRVSRRRAIGTASAAAAFLAVQWLARPVFRGVAEAPVPAARAWVWTLNAVLLLLLLLPVVGFVQGRRVRALVNDEVSRAHARTAAAAGFWFAMAAAIALFLLPASSTLTAREALYLIVTPTTGLAALVFAWLEGRAHRDA